MDDVITGDGWAISSLDRLGDGPGFRKIRTPLGVSAFGMNAIVLPPGIETGRHYHERQQEVYFLHAGSIEMEFGDGATQRLEAGGIARGDPPPGRKIRNLAGPAANYVLVGGAGATLRRGR